MIGEALRLIRVFSDKKQGELAEELGLSKSYVSEIEAGRKQPSIDILEKYAVKFGIPLSAIMLFAESVTDSPADSGPRDAIATKIVNFLRLIESRTKRDDEGED